MTPHTKRNRNRQIGLLLKSAGLAAALCYLPAVSVSADEVDGKAVFEKRCTGCHALDVDHEGPRLRGVFGRPAGSVQTFEYSKALQNAGFTWDAANLEKWLTDTNGLVPGNDMSFRVPKPEERTAIILYLKSLTP
jgi:cytochrome c